MIRGAPRASRSALRLGERPLASGDCATAFGGGVAAFGGRSALRLEERPLAFGDCASAFGRGVAIRTLEKHYQLSFSHLPGQFCLWEPINVILAHFRPF